MDNVIRVDIRARMTTEQAQGLGCSFGALKSFNEYRYLLGP